MRRNERKEMVLAYAQGCPDGFTSIQAAAALEIPVTNASELLRSYHRYRYLRRRKLRQFRERGGAPREYLYLVRPEGIKKLRWLQSQPRQPRLIPDDEWRRLVGGEGVASTVRK